MLRLKSIKVRNFKSLINLNKDFSNKKSDNLIIIYGENGVGKTNFIEITRFLGFLTANLYYINAIRYMAEKQNKTLETQNYFKDFINEYKTLGSKENLEIEIVFQNNKDEVGYYVELNEEEIVKEKITVKDRVIEIEKNEKGIQYNLNGIITEEYKKEFENKIAQYWGKNSFLAIYLLEKGTKNEDYLVKNIEKTFKKGMDLMINNFLAFTEGYEYFKYKKSFGIINIEDREELERYVEKLDIIFRSLYRDILKVYADTREENNKILYEFKLEKRICDKKIIVPFNLESKGTKKILEILPELIEVMNKEIILFIDEIDESIHDKMVVEILKSISNNIKGQLILTTHNTKIMQEKELGKNIYVMIEEDGEKRIEKIKDYETRLHPNLNAEKRYWRGVYGGIPMDINLDFSEVLDEKE